MKCVRFWRFTLLRFLAGLSREKSGDSFWKEKPSRVTIRWDVRLIVPTSVALAQHHGYARDAWSPGIE